MSDRKSIITYEDGMCKYAHYTSDSNIPSHVQISGLVRPEDLFVREDNISPKIVRMLERLLGEGEPIRLVDLGKAKGGV